MNFNFLSPVLGTLSQTHIKFVTLLRGGVSVGTDEFGNKYYEERTKLSPAQSSGNLARRSRRWVIYKAGYVDASEVPPEWHGWLHHQSDTLPTNDEALRFRRHWQKPPVANMTGSSGAYLPPGHQLGTAHRAKATGDYHAWKPAS